MPNIITIDPSLTCTAVVINGHPMAFVAPHLAHNKKGELTKWFTLAKDHASIIVFDKSIFCEDYTNSEINKLTSYNKIIEDIFYKILEIGDADQPTKIFIEGYSYSSQAGPLIDLVTFGTLLRNKLLTITSDITIISPMSLKASAAKLTYPAIEKGKKVKKYEYRNFDGVSGGKFTKHEMFKALIDNTSITSDWINFIKVHKAEIMAMKHIPKPIEDINDAKLMYYVALSNKY